MSGQTCCQAMPKGTSPSCACRYKAHIAYTAIPGKTGPKWIVLADEYRAVGNQRNVVSPTVCLRTSVCRQGSRKATCRTRGYGIVEKANARL